MSDAVAAPFARLLSDERLTRRAVGGDERAFAAIFNRYHQSLYRFCLAIVGNREDAQDALQNTMVKVLRALPGEERKIELKPWLYRIAHNEAIDLIRRRRETSELDVEQIAPGYGLAEDAAARERLRRLLADLRELPERQREVLVMRELSGLGFEEIGSALCTSGAVARQTLYEARQSLRQMEEGREMSCATVVQALSDGDGRVTRRRDVRAHLRSCARCQAFRDEIESRQRDFAALSPLPAVAAAGMLHGLIGGSQGAAAGGGLATTVGGGAAKTIGASAAVKGVATAAVVAAIGVTAADRSGVIHLGVPGEQGAKPAPAAPAQPGGGTASNQPGEGGGRGHGVAGRSGTDSAAAAGGKRAVSAGLEGAPAVPPAAVTVKAHGHQPAAEEVKSEATGTPTEHPHGHDPEAPQPEAASGGQGAGATHKPPAETVSTDGAGHAGGGHPEPPGKPVRSEPPGAEGAPSQEPPASAPKGPVEPLAQQESPSPSPGKANAGEAPASGADHGNGHGQPDSGA